ncbi:MAG: protein kinase [Thermoanaerobaculia bacterium]
MSLPAGARLGPYEVLGSLGAGGMGEVYRARDTRLDRTVAVKVLPEELAKSPEALARFEREAKAVAALNHPNILALFDVGRTDGVAYAVMELLEGESLRSRLARGAFPPRKAIELAVQMAEGLAAAHDKGIVHRDLKPENLWITSDGRLKILDFGLAKVGGPVRGGDGSQIPTGAIEDAARTAEGTILGTLGYMSPEQVRGEAVDARSDIFSFGVVLFEMLSGRRAFGRSTAADTLAAILKEEPPEITGSGAVVPAALDRVARRCLEKVPRDRFQSARDLAFALENLSFGSEGGIPPPSPVAVKKTRAIRIEAALAALILAAVGTGIGLGRWVLRERPPAVPVFRKLTFGRGAIDGARFVPGSRDIAYSARWQGNPSTVYLLREGSLESRALEAQGAILLGASTQGGAAVLTRPALFNGMFVGAVAVLPLAGGGAREISRAAFAADFAGDGSGLCLVTQVGGSQFQLEWPQGEVVLEHSTSILRNPRIRGNQVAFFRSSPAAFADGEIEVLAKGGQPRRLGPFKGFTSLAWSPDGKEVWFSTFDGGESLIQAVSLRGGARLLARAPGRLELVDVDAYGRCLAISSSQLRQAFGRAPGAEREVDLTWLDAQTPSGLRADGSQVLLARWGEWDLSDRTGLYLRSLSGGPAIHVGTGSVSADLSPDGRWVATFEADGKGQPGLRLIPTGAGASRWFPLTDNAANADTFLFQPGGDRGYLLDEDANRMSRIDLATGTITPAGFSGRVGMSSAQSPQAPDGRRMLLVDEGDTRPPEGRLFDYLLFEGEGSRPIPAKGLLGTEAVSGWADDSKEVYVYDRNAIPAVVVRVNPLTGARRPFLQISPSDPSGVWGIRNLTITPSGKAYAYSVVRKLSDLYVIEGLR